MTTLTFGRHAAARRSAAGVHRLRGFGLVGIGAGLAALAALGPLLTGAIDYRVTETLRNQTIGFDLVSLVIVAPLVAGLAAALLRPLFTTNAKGDER